MIRPVAVRALPSYRIWLRYADGVEGEVDLSDLAGRGVFECWNDYHAFENVYIGEQGQVAWSDQIDLCSDALYMELTGKKPEEIFPSLKRAGADA